MNIIKTEVPLQPCAEDREYSEESGFIRNSNTSRPTGAKTDIRTERGSWTLDTRPESILGKGAYGIVYRATDSTGAQVAAKMINETEYPRVLDQNFDKLMELKHDNVVRMFDVSRRGETVYLFMDFCKFGDMNTFFKQQELNLPDKIEMMSQMARGVHYLHDNDIIHRDIKPDNILIAQQTPLCVKLTDFDVSKILDPDAEIAHMGSNVGTLAFKAPEFFRRNTQGEIGYDRNVDVYAAGLTFLGMIQYKKGDAMIVPRIETPREASELHQPIGALIAERIKYDIPQLNIVAVEEPLEGAAAMVTDPVSCLKRLIARMTCVEPEHRLPAAEVVTELQKISAPSGGKTWSSGQGQIESRVTKILGHLRVTKVYDIQVEGFSRISCGWDKVVVRGKKEIMLHDSNNKPLRVDTVCHHDNRVCGLSNRVIEACRRCNCIRVYDLETGTSREVPMPCCPTALCLGPENTLLVMDDRRQLGRLQVHGMSHELDMGYIQTRVTHPILDMAYADVLHLLIFILKPEYGSGYLEAIHVPPELIGDKSRCARSKWTVSKVGGESMSPRGVCVGFIQRVFVADGLKQVLVLDTSNGELLQKIQFEFQILDICWIQGHSCLGVLCPNGSTSTLRYCEVEGA